jgi:hypothetical protein
MTEGEEVVEDYVAMRLTLRKHPMAFLRPKLTPRVDGQNLLASGGGIFPPEEGATLS